MPLISETVSNLVGGVSQQAENLRFSNTATSIENAFLSPVVGMQKRQATEWLGEMTEFGSTTAPTFSDKAACHFINRDETEHYVLVIDADGLRAFDADTGAAIEVIEQTDVSAYLTGDGSGGTMTDFTSGLRFATVADTTFILNRNVTVSGSVDADFLPHHFAAFPQLAYDSNRGGDGLNDGTTVRYRSDAAVTETEFRVTTPSINGNSHVYMAATAVSSSVGVYSASNTSQNARSLTRIYNSANFPNNPHDSANILENALTSSIAQGRHIVFPVHGNYVWNPISGNPAPHQKLANALGFQSSNAIDNQDTFSQRDVLLGTYAWAYNGTTKTAVQPNSNDNFVDISFSVVPSRSYGPNGTYSSLFGKTITNDLRVFAGKIEISDDNGATYRSLRVNDHSTIKLNANATSNRPETTPDIDFDNIGTGLTASTWYVSTTLTYNSGASTKTVAEFASATFPNHASQRTLLNEVLWVLTYSAYNDAGAPANTTQFLGSSYEVIDAYGVTATVVQQGSSSNQVDTFQDLPALNDTSAAISGGSIYEVGGTAIGDGAYYVIVYDDDTGADQRYIETYDVPFVLDESTLPIKVQRSFDSSGNPQFVVSQHKYGPRVVGDEDTNATPSFVGNRINDVFVHGGRLGFLSDENMILSAATDFGDTAQFFRTSVTQLLDTDRIDISMSTGRVDVLQSAVPFANTLLLMSDRAQFRLVAPNALTPATALLQQAASIEASKLSKPIAVGTKVFFAQDNISFSSVMEIGSEIDTQIIEADETTAQVPKYIPSGVHKLTASQKKQMLFALSHSEPNVIYVYKFYENDRQRLQSAWSKWTLNSNTKIVGMEVIEDHLHLAVEVTSKDYIKTLEEAASLGTSFGTTSTRAYMLRVELEEITQASATDFPLLLDLYVPRSKCVEVVGGRTARGGNAYDPNAAEFPIPSGGTPISAGLDWSAIELPYRTDETTFSVLLTDTDAFGITLPRLAATNLKLATSVTVAQFEAAQLAFIGAATVDPNSAATSSAHSALAALIDSTMNNTRFIVLGRLDGVFATDNDRVLNNITTAVTPDFTCGVDYTMTYVQSPLFYKPQGADTGRSEARLQLRYATITFDDTAGFTAEITPKGRSAKNYVFGALQSGDSEILLGQQNFATGSFRFPIFAKNDSVEIKFTNNGPFPSTLTTLEWQGFISPKSMQA